MKNKFDTLRLTDGEPIVSQNKEFLQKLFDVNDLLKIIIPTNGMFAMKENTLNQWLEFFVDGGWDFDSMPSYSFPNEFVNSKLKFSSGVQYPYQLNKTLANRIYVFAKVFDLEDVKDKIAVHFTYDKKSAAGLKAFEKLILELDKLKIIDSVEQDDKLYYVTKLAGSVDVEFGRILEAGRARLFFEGLNYRENMFLPFDLSHTPHPQKHIHIDHDGNVGTGYAAPCAHSSRQFGNILDDSLMDIMSEIKDDPLHWAHKIGSVSFTYFLAREYNPDLVLSGYDNCGVCNQIFEDDGFVKKLRDTFGGSFEVFGPQLSEKYLEFASHRYS